MKINRQQSGFSITELILVLAVIAGLSGLGYLIYERTANNNAADSSTIANDVPQAPPIESASDLDVAETVLDQNDPDTSQEWDESQLNSYLSNF